MFVFVFDFTKNWESLTSDPFILRTVQHGLELDFIEIPITNKPHELLLTPEEKTIIKLEIEKLLAKKIIIKTTRSPNDFISNCFTREKKDGSARMILNLKKLNTYIKYQHFKMESIQTDEDRKNINQASYVSIRLISQSALTKKTKN